LSGRPSSLLKTRLKGMSEDTTAILTVPRITEPALWQVVFLDDDYTPMDFVVGVLRRLFGKDQAEAQDITLAVHENGAAVAGVYTKEIAAQKAFDTCRVAQASGHPLKALAKAL
jgi:ATP-dependent Clp protease adaptor protein ClpS